MTGIPGTETALAELHRISTERRHDIARGNAPAGMVDRLHAVEQAGRIVLLASLITYFEAVDPTPDEARKLGLLLPPP